MPSDTDEEFFTYCLIHSETELHLFSAQDCRRLFRLAKVNFPECRLPDTAFRGMDRWTVRELVGKARAIKVSVSASHLQNQRDAYEGGC